MNICIYGASSAQLEQIYYDKTEELGKMMAKRGHGLVFGGGATGMMGSAARGVDVEGGYILVLHLDFLINRVFCIRTAVNLFLQIPCASAKNFSRSALMQQSLHRAESEPMKNFLRS